MAGARVMYAGLQLLDRQLVGRDGKLCGKVDDLALAEQPGTGHLYVTAIRSGPGALLTRTAHGRLGEWLTRVATLVFASERDQPVDIPFARVADISDHVTLSLDSHDVAGNAGERWVRDHVIDHIPGSDHDADR